MKNIGMLGSHGGARLLGQRISSCKVSSAKTVEACGWLDKETAGTMLSGACLLIVPADIGCFS